MNITKTDLLKYISENITCFEELQNKMCEAVSDSPYLTKDAKRIVKKIIKKRISKAEKKEMAGEFYNKLEEAVFKELSNRENYSKSDCNEIVLRLFEGISIKSKFLPEHEAQFNFAVKTITCGEKIQIKPKITDSYKQKINETAFN